MKTKKIVAAKSNSNKVTEKKSVKKIELKKVVVQAQKSISRLVFKFLNEEKILECDNRKEKFEKLLKMVQKEFPSSKFQKTHFYWYITRLKKQLEHNLEVDHLVSIPKIETK